MTLPCGCCKGIHRMTPVEISNPPNMTGLSYRVGSHATFFDSMLARLSQYETDPLQPLQKLTTRLSDDPSIALLDTWALVADVLTFYQERIANEGYLPTATERRSIMELAALVDYTLKPGLAASGYLAFSLQDGYSTDVPAGTRAQTLPGPGELPQPFETSAPLTARAAWNQLPPRLTKQQVITETQDTAIYLAGTTTNLKPNDPLLIVFGAGAKQQEPRRVQTVTPEPAFNRTRVDLQPSTVSAAVAAAARAANRVIERNLDPRSVPSPQSALAGEVIETLKAAQAGLSLAMD